MNKQTDTPTTGDHGTQLDAFSTTGSSPTMPYVVHDVDIARQMVDLGCYLVGDEAEAEQRDEWVFLDERAVDFALFLRATPKQREYFRTHDCRMRPDPVHAQKVKAPKMYGFGHFEGYGYDGDDLDAGGYVTAATGGELLGWGIHTETQTRAEAMPNPDNDAQVAYARLAQAGVDNAADHPASGASNRPLPTLRTVRQEVLACNEEALPSAGTAIATAANQKMYTATALLKQLGQSAKGKMSNDEQVQEQLSGDDECDTVDYEPRVVPADRTETEQEANPCGRKRIE